MINLNYISTLARDYEKLCLAEAEGGIDLTKATDFSYSAIMREMRQHATSEQIREFLILFKKQFDKAIKHKKKEPDQVALKAAMAVFDDKYGVKLKMKKKASNELGDAAQVGKYLANIVKFTISKIPLERRPAAIESLKTKFYSMNSNDLAAKNLPAMAGIGQSITFVKHVLFNHDAGYIREVLNHLVNNL